MRTSQKKLSPRRGCRLSIHAYGVELAIRRDGLKIHGAESVLMGHGVAVHVDGQLG